MNEFETEQLETELQRLKPALPPEDFMTRVAARWPHRNPVRSMSTLPISFARLLKWFAPLTAATALLALFFIKQSRDMAVKSPNLIALLPIGQTVKADNVEIVQRLVATFDAVAHLATGEPVRFRCSEWVDDVVLRDSSQGILIQHRIPRLEVKPVYSDTY